MNSSLRGIIFPFSQAPTIDPRVGHYKNLLRVVIGYQRYRREIRNALKTILFAGAMALATGTVGLRARSGTKHSRVTQNRSNRWLSPARCCDDVRSMRKVSAADPDPREELATSAPDTFNDIAKNLTVAGGAEFQNETGNLIGMSQLNLRGLELGSSLVLINGRRGGISTIADGGGNQFFDINQLPLAMVERIDVLTDGASATYGSQAVAGVANIITRKGFRRTGAVGRVRRLGERVADRQPCRRWQDR